jgi:hypothetical protein
VKVGTSGGRWSPLQSAGERWILLEPGGCCKRSMERWPLWRHVTKASHICVREALGSLIGSRLPGIQARPAVSLTHFPKFL